MKVRLFLALAGLFVATPASAVTVLLEPNDFTYDSSLVQGTYLDTGVYLARFAFDRPVVAGALSFIYSQSYDFYGIDDGEYYGGNDTFTYWDHSFDGGVFTTIFKIERPYRSVHHWGGVGDIEEFRRFYLEATFGDFIFASTEPVQLDYSFERLSAVPEPSSWAMLITGFGLAGWKWRRNLPKGPDFAKTSSAKGWRFWASKDFM